jgi:hypothetical protein
MCSPVRASQIAHALKLPRISVVRRLEEMIKHGYVERVGNAYRVNIPELQKKLQRRIEMVTNTAKRLSELGGGRNRPRVIWRTPCRTQGARKPLAPSTDEATNTPGTGDWRCGYCQVGWWWLSASPSGAGSHSRPTPRTPQPLSKPHRLTQQRTKLSTPTGAPSTASSGATIAIASEREVGAVSSAGYPIVELLTR